MEIFRKILSLDTSWKKEVKINVLIFAFQLIQIKRLLHLPWNHIVPIIERQLQKPFTDYKLGKNFQNVILLKMSMDLHQV